MRGCPTPSFWSFSSFILFTFKQVNISHFVFRSSQAEILFLLTFQGNPSNVGYADRTETQNVPTRLTTRPSPSRTALSSLIWSIFQASSRQCAEKLDKKSMEIGDIFALVLGLANLEWAEMNVTAFTVQALTIFMLNTAHAGMLY